MNNKEIADFIFAKIKSYGFIPYEIDYDGEYFFCDFGENAIIEFRIKNVSKHWKFAMWVHCENMEIDYKDVKEASPVVEFFCQYDKLIDKFKPSRSNLCVNLYKYDIENEMENKLFSFHDLYEMLFMIKRHPFLSYDIDQYWNGFHGNHYMIEFFKSEAKLFLQNVRHRFKKIFIPYTKMKILLSRNASCIDSIYFDESPFYNNDFYVRITFTKDSTKDEEERWINKWFKKDEYGKYAPYSYVVKMDCARKVGINVNDIFSSKKD